MSAKILLLLLASVSLSSIAQIVLKTGLSQPQVTVALDGGSYFNAVTAVFINWWVVVGLFVYFLAAVVWLFALARIEVSMAYPFVGVGFILTMVLGKFLMGDAITATRLFGTILISVGVVFVSWR
jgi:multidrug transporter EmrE-like cation transporter